MTEGGSTSGMATIALTGPFHQALVRESRQAMGVPITSRIRVTMLASLAVSQMAWRSLSVSMFSGVKGGE